MNRGDIFLIKETGKLIAYKDRLCVDFHKGLYEDAYEFVYPNGIPLIFESELTDYTLIPCNSTSNAAVTLFGESNIKN